MNRKEWFLNILIEKEISELNLFMRLKIGIEGNKISFEEDSGHLAMAGIVGIDEDECKDFYFRLKLRMDDLCLV